ncbi:MAG: 1-deoxy-D-xylulose-5-phosphate reductoisomerase [Planctomycetota bacterium]
MSEGASGSKSTVEKAATTENVNVAVLGATGSVGTATIDVLENLNRVDPHSTWNLWAASGHRNLDLLFQLARRFDDPPRLILSDLGVAEKCLQDRDPSGYGGVIEQGAEALVSVAEAAEVDVVVASIVGRAGLESTLAAVHAGKRVALANKETLVVAGPVVSQAGKTSGAQLLPVDSEHSAIFQCIQAANSPPKKLILTASGGPFRTWTQKEMEAATRDSALAHPTWDMGPKITIDSATMMNKALEIIEARWLFDLPADAIEVVVHPQSIIHSMVEFEDGSVIAQLSPPDMRLPIQYALTYPRRLPCQAPTLDRTQNWNLDLEVPDFDRFPALQLGFEVARKGGTTGAVLNAANEEAVGLFLDGKIRFTEIATGCRDVLEAHDFEPNPPLDQLLKLDLWARNELRNRFGQA